MPPSPRAHAVLVSYRDRQALALAASQWEIGTSVVARLCDGSTVHTQTRSRPYALADGSAVVLLEAHWGPVALDRVRLDL